MLLKKYICTKFIRFRRVPNNEPCRLCKFWNENIGRECKSIKTNIHNYPIENLCEDNTLINKFRRGKAINYIPQDIKYIKYIKIKEGI